MVSYEHGLLWTSLLWTGLLWTGLLWTRSVLRGNRSRPVPASFTTKTWPETFETATHKSMPRHTLESDTESLVSITVANIRKLSFLHRLAWRLTSIVCSTRRVLLKYKSGIDRFCPAQAYSVILFVLRCQSFHSNLKFAACRCRLFTCSILKVYSRNVFTSFEHIKELHFEYFNEIFHTWTTFLSHFRSCKNAGRLHITWLGKLKFLWIGTDLPYQ